jgi:hypothetical protein
LPKQEKSHPKVQQTEQKARRPARERGAQKKEMNPFRRKLKIKRFLNALPRRAGQGQKGLTLLFPSPDPSAVKR